MTAPATGTSAPAAPTGTTEPPVAPQAPIEAPAAEPATGPAEGELGEAGKAALKQEREARKAAERAQKALEARVKEFEDAQKTEAERNADRIKQLEEDAAKAIRYEAAVEAELPLSLAGRLIGNTREELVADAVKLKEQLGATARVAAPLTPKPDLRQGGGPVDAGSSMATGAALYAARKQRNPQ